MFSAAAAVVVVKVPLLVEASQGGRGWTRTYDEIWVVTAPERQVIDRVLAPGDAFLIPLQVVHFGVATAGPARVLDIFSPVREDDVNRYNRFTGIGSDTRCHVR